VAALAAAILTPVTTATAQEPIIVDATSDRFSASDNWGTSSWSSQKYGDEYRFTTPDTTASDPAWYRAEIPADGRYLVEVWYPADSGYNNSTPYMVATPSGLQSVTVNQRTNGGQWVRLGAFNLVAGDYDVVGISRWTNGTGYIIADAIRISEATDDADWALVLPQDALARWYYDRPHHTYPAIDLPVPTGTPSYAVRSGTVRRVNDSSCGLGIVLTGDDGAVYTYCHFSAFAVSTGERVEPGQRIGSTGNTGHSTGPHLHFQIRTPDGLLRCPQRMLLAIYDGQTPPAANQLPTSGCSY
jgi:murein DD-endopeptidase MepM/ murein hydrolase activator NlpD